MPSVILLDVSGVIVGTLAGCAVKKYIPESLNESINLALAVISAAIGISLLGKTTHMSAAVLAFLIGGTVGHIIGIDRQLTNISKFLPATGGSETAHTVLTAFTIYCVSTTGVIGALTLGFEGDATILMTKAIMDCVSSVFFAGSSGWILSLISIPLGILLIVFYGLSEFLMPHLTADMIGDFSACGGLIMLLNVLRITKLKNPPVADYIPSLALVFFTSVFWTKYM